MEMLVAALYELVQHHTGKQKKLQYYNHDFPIEIIKVTKLEAGDARSIINE